MPDSARIDDGEHGSTEPLKSMRLFFIDNQRNWPADAQLAGDFVIWPDNGVYPTAQPVSLAKHSAFDGRIVVQAGNQTIIVTLCPGAKDQEDVRKQLSTRKLADRPEQYRIAVDGLVQRLLLWRDQAASEVRDNVNPFALLKWLKTAHSDEARVLRAGLELLMKNGAAIEALIAKGVADAWDHADEMSSALAHTVVEKSTTP